ncbi:hypothetical protein ACHQM5_022435 [Ranunculus cassubicifolius]
MSWELILLSISTVVVLALLVGTIYQLFSLGDLEYDYINPYDLAAKINALITREFVLQGTLCAFFLLTWHWFLFLMSAPVTYYHIQLYMKRKHLIDVTEVFRVLESEKYYRVVKLVFYMLLFVTLLFRLVVTGVQEIVGEQVSFHGFYGVF